MTITLDDIHMGRGQHFRNPQLIVDAVNGAGGLGIATYSYTGDGNNGRAISLRAITRPPKVAIWVGNGLALFKTNFFAGDLFKVLDNGNPVNGVTFSGNDIVVDGVFAANALGIDYDWMIWF